jgi:predicted SAM-dependent methyltransferase
MITVYGLTFWNLKNLQTSLNSIIKNASEPIKIVVGDSYSKNSEQIRKWLLEIGESKLIHSAVFFEENIRTKGFIQMYNAVPPTEEDFFVFTELDLVVPDGLDWIKEIRDLRKQGAVDCGFSLDLSNYVPPNHGHSSDESGNAMGIWLVGVDRRIFESFPKGGRFNDAILHQFMESRGKKIRSRKQLYHLAWDLWKEDPEYWALKTTPQPGFFDNDNESRYKLYSQQDDSDKIKLHIGCGDHYLQGWVNIDGDDKYKNDLKHDLSKGLPYEANSVDAILSNHFIEHLDKQQGILFLHECYRTLKPGGVLRMSTPDLQFMINDYETSRKTGKIVSYWNDNPKFQTACEMFNVSMDSGQQWGHKYTYDAEDLVSKLAAAGFKNVVRKSYEKASDIFKGCTPDRSECLIIEAKK